MSSISDNLEYSLHVIKDQIDELEYKYNNLVCELADMDDTLNGKSIDYNSFESYTRCKKIAELMGIKLDYWQYCGKY